MVPPTSEASSARERSIRSFGKLLLLVRRGGRRRRRAGLDLVLLVVGADQLRGQVQRVRSIGDPTGVEDHREPLLLGDGGDDGAHLGDDRLELLVLLLGELGPTLLEALLELDEALLEALGL